MAALEGVKVSLPTATSGPDVRSSGHFSSRYSLLTSETLHLFGPQPGMPHQHQQASNSVAGASNNSVAAHSTAVGVHDFVEARWLCSRRPVSQQGSAGSSSKLSPVTGKQERRSIEPGPRWELRKFTFVYRHKRGALEDDPKAFAAECMDAAFPQLKLWQSLCSALPAMNTFSLQKVVDTWVEVEEPVSAPTSPLIPAPPQDNRFNAAPMSWSQRKARKQLGLDEDDDDDLASLLRLVDTKVSAFVMLEPLMPPRCYSVRSAHRLKTLPLQCGTAAPATQCESPLRSRSGEGLYASGEYALSSEPTATNFGIQGASTEMPSTVLRDAPLTEEPPWENSINEVPITGALLWDEREVKLVLLHLCQLAKLSTQFTRKGERRRSCDEHTIMLDLDEDHVFVEVPRAGAGGEGSHAGDLPAAEADGSSRIPRITKVLCCIDIIGTTCRFRDNKWIQSPSLVLIQHDFDVALWSRVRFPTAAPHATLTAQGARGCSSPTLVLQESHVVTDETMVSHPSNVGGAKQQQGREAAAPSATFLGLEGLSPSDRALVGLRTSMFLVGLLMIRLGKRENFDTRLVRTAYVPPPRLPPNGIVPPLAPNSYYASRPPFFMEDDGSLRYDATFRSLVVQLIDDDSRRPGPTQVIATLLQQSEETSKKHAPMKGLQPPSAPPAARKTATNLNPSAPPRKDLRSSRVPRVADQLQLLMPKASSAAHESAEVSERQLTDLLHASQMQQRGYAKAGGSPRKTPHTPPSSRGKATVPTKSEADSRPTSSQRSSTASQVPVSETPFELQQRRQIREYLSSIASAFQVETDAFVRRDILMMVQDPPQNWFPSPGVSSALFGGSACKTPSRNNGTAGLTRPSTRHEVVHRPNPNATPAEPLSDGALLKTAETPANDVRPSPRRLSHRGSTPVVSLFEL